jgi:hypothetical protein
MRRRDLPTFTPYCWAKEKVEKYLNAHGLQVVWYDDERVLHLDA